MNKLRTFLQEHKSALILSAVIGLIFLLPQLLMPILSENPYSPFAVKGTDARSVDEVLYAQYLREVMDGHFPTSNVYEEKQDFHFSYIGAPFPSIVLGGIAKLIGINATYIISLFIFTAISTFLTYLIALKITQNKIISLIAPALLFFSPTYMLKFATDNITQPISYFSRFYPVLFDYPVFAAILLLLIITIEKKSWTYAVITGLAGGLLFYTYFYYWTFYGVFLTILFINHLNNKPIAKLIAASAIITLIIGLPFLLSFLTDSSTGSLVNRHVTDATRTINYPITLLLGVTLAAIKIVNSLKNTPTEKPDNSFINALILASILVMNIQLILGFTVSPRHWLTTTIWPCLIIAGSYIANILITRFWRDYFYKVLQSVVVILLIFGATWQSVFAVTMADEFTIPEPQSELYTWLNQNTNNDDVVATLNSELILLLPVYTHNNNFIPNAITESTSVAENIERRLIVYKLLNAETKDFIFLSSTCAIKTLWKDEFEKIKGAQYRYDLFEPAVSHLLTFHIASETIADGCNVKQNVRDSINQLYNTLPNKSTKYRMDYVVISDVEKEITKQNPEIKGTVVFENEEFKVVKVK